MLHADNQSCSWLISESIIHDISQMHSKPFQNLTLNTTSFERKNTSLKTNSSPLKNAGFLRLFSFGSGPFSGDMSEFLGMLSFVTDYRDRTKISAETPKRQTAWFPSRRRWSISVEMASHSESELVRVSTRRIMRPFKGRVHEPLFCRGVEKGRDRCLSFPMLRVRLPWGVPPIVVITRNITISFYLQRCWPIPILPSLQVARYFVTHMNGWC